MSKHTAAADAVTAASPIRTRPVTLETVSPLDLRVGDVVLLSYGARVLLDREPARFPDHSSGREVYTWSGLLLNVDHARECGFPVGWCDITPHHADPAAEYRWTVQGNNLASVTREVGA